MRLTRTFKRLLPLALLTASAAALVPATADALRPRATLGARGTVARAVLVDQTAVDVRGRPVAAFVQAFEGRLRFVVSRWTADGRVDRAFGDASVGPGTSQLFADVPLLSVISTRVAGTPDGGLVVAASLQVEGGVRVAVLRLDDDGAAVAGFGTDGVALAGDGELTAGPIALA
ncbi:MAG: hypothetical protein QOI73_3064, partial [Solirubrobacteraceae bacterium]|nr:hypothetical protein [Solirubrobacteraceae bacterium]